MVVESERMEAHISSCGKKVGVVTAFLQVHDHIEQRNLVSSTTSVQSFKVACQDVLVIFPVPEKQNIESEAIAI